MRLPWTFWVIHVFSAKCLDNGYIGTQSGRYSNSRGSLEGWATSQGNRGMLAAPTLSKRLETLSLCVLRAEVGNLWPGCHGRLLLTTDSSKQFTITALGDCGPANTKVLNSRTLAL